MARPSLVQKPMRSAGMSGYLSSIKKDRAEPRKKLARYIKLNRKLDSGKSSLPPHRIAELGKRIKKQESRVRIQLPKF